MSATVAPVTSLTAKVRRLYGEHPAHALVLLATLVPAALALSQLFDERRIDVGKWLVGAAVLHDGLLLPLYVLADARAVALWRRRPGRVAWLNFVRVPLAVSGMLLLMYSPVILGKATSFQQKTGRSTDPYLGHWLLVTAILAAGSALWYLTRVIVVRRRVT
jgi:hypothetical protein